MKISDKKKKEMLRTMILSRKFSDSLVELFKIEGKIPGMMILSTGQEAVGSGVCAALEPDDAIITNHRSHNHLLAKGADPKSLMAEIYGKKPGATKVKAGPCIWPYLKSVPPAPPQWWGPPCPLPWAGPLPSNTEKNPG